jgi:hypothetical protein
MKGKTVREAIALHLGTRAQSWVRAVPVPDQANTAIEINGVRAGDRCANQLNRAGVQAQLAWIFGVLAVESLDL